MFKIIDKFVFFTNLLSYTIFFIFLFLGVTKDYKFLEYSKYVAYPFGFLIFARFMTDDGMDWRYYIGYVISSIIICKFLEFSSMMVIKDLITLLLGYVFVALTSSFLTGFIYEKFKVMSYKKNNII